MPPNAGPEGTHAAPTGTSGQSLGGNQVHGEFRMTADHQAVRPPRRATRIERDLARSGKQNTEHILRFHPSKGCSNAVMNAPAERNMSAWNFPSHVDGLGMIKHRRISVGSTPEE